MNSADNFFLSPYLAKFTQTLRLTSDDSSVLSKWKFPYGEQNLHKLTTSLGLFFLMLISTASFSQTPIKTRKVTVTAYSQPGKTASGEKASKGHIALSRDLERQYNARFGDIIVVKGVGKFRFKDRMPRKWKKRIDIYMPSSNQAKAFGKKKKAIYIVKRSSGTRSKMNQQARRSSNSKLRRS